MDTKELKKRSDLPEEFKWDVASMYADDEKWEADIKSAISGSAEFAKMQDHIMDSPQTLLEAIRLYLQTMRTLENAFVYARMRHDEDNADAKFTEMSGKVMSVAANVSAALSFFTPELLSSPQDQVAGYISQEPALEEYKFMLDSIFKNKEHVLSSDHENLMSTLSEVLHGPDQAFTMLNNADMHFGKVINDAGEEVELTHGNYTKLMESTSPAVRKAVFGQLYGEFKKLNNTISVLYNYNVKTDVITSRIRKYASTIEAALSSEQIPIAVYDNLIEAVHKHLPDMHRYVAIRKRAMGLDELHMYDIYKPLVKPAGLECTYQQAIDIACRALEPLGQDYVQTLRRGLAEGKWVDVYENQGKTSGAYSFGSYDSKPYILMNFNGELSDVFTLVHEGGHSMHSYLTRSTQPFQYGSHSIFTAEVASTVNETLLIRYLLQNADSDEMKMYLLNLYIDGFKSTLFRQTMFAEFERHTHEVVEQGGSLTAEFLNGEYDKLNSLYFGPDVAHDDFIQYEWSRIPHFYRAFYVYQYATGYSAAQALADRIINGGDKEREDYLRFLSLGDSDYPIELLKIAGVDMSTQQPVLSALSVFSELLDQLEKMI